MAHVLNRDKLQLLDVVTFFTCNILGTQLKFVKFCKLWISVCFNLTCILSVY